MGRYRYYPTDLPPSERVEFSDNRNPGLRWQDAPDGTQSFVLLCHDRDAPSDRSLVNRADRGIPRELARTRFYHWVLVDLPATVLHIDEGQFSDEVRKGGKSGPDAPLGSRQGLNDYSYWFADDPEMRGEYFGYDGPFPPWNDKRIHRYVFELFALDTPRLPLEGSFDANAVLAAVEGHVLASAEVRGFYFLDQEARFAPEG